MISKKNWAIFASFLILNVLGPIDVKATEKVIGYWPLNEGRGNIVKNKHGENNGIFELNGGKKKNYWRGKELIFPGGKGNGAIKIMNGKSILTGPYFHLSIDVKRAEKSHEGVIFANKDQVTKKGGFLLKHWGGGNRILFNFADGSKYYRLSTKYAMPINKWVTITVLYDGLYLKIFAEGKIVGTKKIPGAILQAGSMDLRLGGYYNSKLRWNGSFRNFRMSIPSLKSIPNAEEYGIYKVNKTKEQITIDGNLNEPMWEKAKFYSGFTRFYPKKKALSDTQFSLVAGEKNLYIAVKNFLKNPKKIIIGKDRKRDGDIYSDDSVELFIDPDKSGNHYFQIMLNAGNKILDSVTTYYGNSHRSDFNMKIDSATKILKNSWVAEIRIPYSELAVKSDSNGVWNFNIGRNDTTVDKRFKYSSWGSLKEGEKNTGFHNFKLFQTFTGFPKPKYSPKEKQMVQKTRKIWDLNIKPSQNAIELIPVHKTMIVANNMSLPNWFKSRVPASTFMKFKTTFYFDFPEGVKITALNGPYGGQWNLSETPVKHDGENYTRYALKAINLHRKLQLIGTFFMRSTLKNNTNVSAYYFAKYEGGKQPLQKINILIKTMPTVRMPKKLHSSIGWMFASDWLTWPDFLKSYSGLGFNAFGTHSKRDKDIPLNKILNIVNKARAMGMKIISTQSPFATLRNYPEAKSISLTGKVETKPKDLCPAYRGKYYQEELNKIATGAALLKADYVILDVECYHDGSFAGKSNSCLRCNKWIKKSRKKPVDAIVELGTQIAVDSKKAINKAFKEIGKKSPLLGFYHTLPGKFIYQDTFNYDKMHRKGGADFSMPIAYKPTKAMETGNEMRRLKKLQPKGNIITWGTTGYFDLAANVMEYPYEWTYDYTIELFANGARGVTWFCFTGFETADFYYLSKAMQSIVLVEDLIYDSTQMKNISTNSLNIDAHGLKKGNEILILLTEYKNGTPGKVTVTLPKAASGNVFDLARNKKIGTINNGKTIEIDFKPGVKGAHTALYLITTKNVLK